MDQTSATEEEMAAAHLANIEYRHLVAPCTRATSEIVLYPGGGSNVAYECE